MTKKPRKNLSDREAQRRKEQTKKSSVDAAPRPGEPLTNRSGAGIVVSAMRRTKSGRGKS